MTADLAGVELPISGADRIGLRRRRSRARPVLRHHRARRRRHQVASCSHPRSGRPTPRMAETPSGMLNSIGLQGPGIEAFIEKDLAWLRQRGARAVVSIAGGSVDEYTRLAAKLRHVEGVSAPSRSTSRAPTSRVAGRCSPATRTPAADVVAAVRRTRRRASRCSRSCHPDVTDIVEIARSVVDAGADGLSMINTLLGHGHRHRHDAPGARRRHRRAVRAGDPAGRRARGLAGAPAMPEIPILGMGGIKTGLDALEFVLAGPAVSASAP